MLNSLKRYVMLSLVAMGAILGVMWRIAVGQKKKAQSRAERAERNVKAVRERYNIEQKVKNVSQQAKEEGDAAVKKAVDDARSGDRSHFMRD